MSIRDEKLTAEQKVILVQFMESHADFARNKILGVSGRETTQNLWAILATQLNACGPSKSVPKWQTAWKGMKMKSKKKLSAIKQNRNKTGGGPAKDIPISDLDERIINIITEEAVFGVNDPEVGVSLETEASTTLDPNLSSSWVQSTVEEEAVHMTRRPSIYEEIASDQASPSPSMSTVLPSSKRNKKNAKQKYAEAFQYLASETVNEIIALKEEVKGLKENVGRIAENQIQTNILLERIALALENK